MTGPLTQQVHPTKLARCQMEATYRIVYQLYLNSTFNRLFNPMSEMDHMQYSRHLLVPSTAILLNKLFRRHYLWADLTMKVIQILFIASVHSAGLIKTSLLLPASMLLRHQQPHRHRKTTSSSKRFGLAYKHRFWKGQQRALYLSGTMIHIGKL
ncbi:hypothetical protein BDV37DRAFT_242890 [Aspergillus pseudonomiae]|uniref:Uncharacterized protein n=1 Tax=Aspergillus pseudonomiae TaxID=1506151 RepID=A0A5N7DJU2_9EURO|nr:uncharacterized protein BDV37DRAFT_242890 [Aspergillus pseudonomiae]KAE8406283.1 hypothetical protein BDV37DRAFT_242890 [Aspergillus pseudonomiae]